MENALNNLSTIPCGPLTGEARETACRLMAEAYDAGASIRTIAGRTGGSFGGVRDLLLQAGVCLRPRGGARAATR